MVKSSFEITDKDRSAGIYYVRYQGKGADGEQSWWGQLWDSDEMPALADEVFQVSMQSLPQQVVTITLRPQDAGVPFGMREQQELLSVIKGNIN